MERMKKIRHKVHGIIGTIEEKQTEYGKYALEIQTQGVFFRYAHHGCTLECTNISYNGTSRR